MLPIKIAYRFLSSSKFQTVAIIFGIGVGVSVQIFIGSLIAGLQQDLIETTIGNSSHITIKNKDAGYIEDYDTKMLDIKNASDNITVVSEAVDAQGTGINSGNLTPILLRGFNFQNANQIYDFENKLVDGVIPTVNNQVAVGSGVLEKLGLEINDSFEFEISTLGTSTFVIIGVLDFGVRTINETWAVATLETVQNSLNIGNVLTSIETQVKDVFRADIDSINVAGLFDASTYNVESWIDSNEQLLSGLQGQSTSSLMIQIFVMISVVLGISSVLAITVVQKSKQIGILKAMGIKNKDASLIFLVQGFLLGIFGSIIGVILGITLVYSFSIFAVDTSGNPVVSVLIEPGFMALSAIIAVIASTSAALIPAIKSSKISVIEVIRNG